MDSTLRFGTINPPDTQPPVTMRKKNCKRNVCSEGNEVNFEDGESLISANKLDSLSKQQSQDFQKGRHQKLKLTVMDGSNEDLGNISANETINEDKKKYKKRKNNKSKTTDGFPNGLQRSDVDKGCSENPSKKSKSKRKHECNIEDEDILPEVQNEFSVEGEDIDIVDSLLLFKDNIKKQAKINNKLTKTDVKSPKDTMMYGINKNINYNTLQCSVEVPEKKKHKKKLKTEVEIKECSNLKEGGIFQMQGNASEKNNINKVNCLPETVNNTVTPVASSHSRPCLSPTKEEDDVAFEQKIQAHERKLKNKYKKKNPINDISTIGMPVSINQIKSKFPATVEVNEKYMNDETSELINQNSEEIKGNLDLNHQIESNKYSKTDSKVKVCTVKKSNQLENRFSINSFNTKKGPQNKISKKTKLNKDIDQFRNKILEKYLNNTKVEKDCKVSESNNKSEKCCKTNFKGRKGPKTNEIEMIRQELISKALSKVTSQTLLSGQSSEIKNSCSTINPDNEILTEFKSTTHPENFNSLKVIKSENQPKTKKVADVRQLLLSAALKNFSPKAPSKKNKSHRKNKEK